MEVKRKTSWPEGGPTLDKEKRRKKERTSKLERGKSRIVTKKQNWIKSQKFSILDMF